MLSGHKYYRAYLCKYKYEDSSDDSFSPTCHIIEDAERIFFVYCGQKSLLEE